MIKLILLAVVPFMTQHRNVVPKTEVSTNFYGSVTGIVDKAYIEARIGAGGGGGGCDTNAVDALANSAVVTNALTVATTNRIAALETATNNLSSSVSGLASSKADRPALPVTAGNLAALTADGNLADSGIVTNLILSLRGKQDLRIYMYGYGSRLSSDCLPVTLDGEVVSYSIGRSGYGEHDFPTLVINGEVLCTFTNEGVYDGGYDGLLFNGRSAVLGKYPYLDPASVVDFPTDRIARKSDIPSISATNPTFSNAVLAVGLNIDTNSVAVLNEIAATFGGFPIEGTATTVGGLLAALAAAIAWLKKNKVGSFESVGGATATVENGVATLSDFFTESNSLLTGTIDDRLPIPISAKSAGFTTESYKRFVVTVSGDMTVTLHTPTIGDAEIFECRFNGASLSADASITFAGATATTMDANCGTVTAGKVALMSAFWNGATWDVNWKVEG